MAGTSAIEHPAAKGAAMDLVITRTFDAPREQAWKAWTEPELFQKWWGPKEFTLPIVRIDLRPGGKYFYCMRGAGPDGVVKDYCGTGFYKELVPLIRIVCTDSFADDKGNVVPATHHGMGEDFPLEMLITVTFEDLGRKTGLTLRHSGIPAGQMHELTKAGWSESFDKLAKVLK